MAAIGRPIHADEGLLLAGKRLIALPMAAVQLKIPRGVGKGLKVTRCRLS